MILHLFKAAGEGIINNLYFSWLHFELVFAEPHGIDWNKIIFNMGEKRVKKNNSIKHH